jgi:hypothetical protein
VSDNLGGFFDFLYQATPYDPEKGTSPTLIQKFKDKAREWAENVVELVNTPTYGNVLLESKKAKLLKWAKVIRKGVESTTGTIDELESVDLGVVPAIVPVAVIAASIAAMTKWGIDYKKFRDEVALQESLIKSGVPPQQASQMVANIGKKAPLISVDNPKLIGIGVLAVGGYMLAKSQGWIR